MQNWNFSYSLCGYETLPFTLSEGRSKIYKICVSQNKVYLDSTFYVSKHSCVLTDTYSIHYVIMSHTSIKEERRLTEFKDRVLRRIFGPKRKEVTGDLRKVHNEELHYFTPHQILFG